MKLVVNNIEVQRGEIYVVGNTRIGYIKGRWQHSAPPIMNETYFFELNIAAIDGSEISVLNNKQFDPCVFLNNDQVHFQGICEAIDGIYVIRFSPDWIELVEINNADSLIQIGDRIQFSTNYNAIEIFPYF